MFCFPEGDWSFRGQILAEFSKKDGGSVEVFGDFRYSEL